MAVGQPASPPLAGSLPTSTGPSETSSFQGLMMAQVWESGRAPPRHRGGWLPEATNPSVEFLGCTALFGSQQRWP